MSNAEAIIVSCGDTSKYLIGTSAGRGTVTYQRSKDGDLMFFECLNTAKEALTQQGFTSATLVMDNPYDEMIGEEASETSSHVISL
ncbi:hypothetical protein RN22_04685 [Grimontia sp. AD028]|uniref:Uncharacterized protein n=2 Tax=Grimontia TaxID=246861 RepID=R1ISR3_9GAMM|nr:MULTISPECIES: DUF6482 family protein [Grimontia]EOD78385.1 hypothetical protein D515_02956 [Grimontia indica]KKD61653.1 hypothetical protein RN22_04685 [Grimontia sp. AD028]NGN97384.1 hypothetical protein [Grimontia sedimenti]